MTFLCSGVYSICISSEKSPFIRPTISDQYLSVYFGPYVLYDGGQFPTVPVSKDSPIALSIINLPGIWNPTEFPIISVGQNFAHVFCAQYDSSAGKARLDFLIPSNQSGLEGLSSGFILFEDKFQKIPVEFQFEYFDDRLPYIASILQPNCQDSNCEAVEVENRGSSLISAQVAGIITKFAVSYSGNCVSFVFGN